MKVVLDTNVIISGLMYPQSVPGKILAACQSGAFDWLGSEELAEELEDALLYPSVAKILKFDRERAGAFIARFRFQATFTDTIGVKASVPGDSYDDFVLAALIASRADWLISGDKALLALAPGHAVITPSDFWKRFGA